MCIESGVRQLSRCPLCMGQSAVELAAAQGRTYSRCPLCRLVFMAPQHRLPLAEERAHYRLHRNDPADHRYRRFLARVAEPLAPRVRPAAEGLDYGCGPGPTLSVMLRERGFDVRDYDPCFRPDESALRRTYDFITCTETAEHFHSPAQEFHRFDQLLRPGGWLALMTEVLDDACPFQTWWYVRDPTHVCFYARPTLEWIGRWREWRVFHPSKNVTLFLKRN
jgi:hypothetical protein